MEKRDQDMELVRTQRQVRTLQAIVVEKQSQIHHVEDESMDYFGKLEDLKDEYERQFQEEVSKRHALEHELEQMRCA
jgi:chromosome segregation ATPase